MKRTGHYLALRLLLPLLPLLLSCSEKTTDPGIDEQAIMPLAVGNRWIGRVSQRVSGGTGTETYLDTIALVGERNQPKATSGIAYVDNRGWEWYFVGDELHIDSCTFALLPVSSECGPVAKYPATEGERFGERLADSIVIADSSGQPVRVALYVDMLVERTDTTIVVQAGEFRTAMYRERVVSPESITYPTTNRSFYSPGVGVILYVQEEDGGEVDYRWELIEYSVN